MSLTVTGPRVSRLLPRLAFLATLAAGCKPSSSTTEVAPRQQATPTTTVPATRPTAVPVQEQPRVPVASAPIVSALADNFPVTVTNVCKTGQRGNDGTLEYRVTAGLTDPVPAGFTSGEWCILTDQCYPQGSFETVPGARSLLITGYIHHSLQGREGARATISNGTTDLHSALFPIRVLGTQDCR